MSSAEIKKRLVVGVAGVLSAAGIVIPIWMIATRPEPPQLGLPVPLGTNELKVGAKLYNPNNPSNLVFTVLELNPAYVFPRREHPSWRCED